MKLVSLSAPVQVRFQNLLHRSLRLRCRRQGPAVFAPVALTAINGGADPAST